MDIKELKAEFEKLKYIEEKLEYLNFDEHLDCYVEKSNGMPVGLAAWVNGAFYGFEQAAKAQAVLEKDAIIQKLSDQLYAQEMKTSGARVLCETACELLDGYAHQDAMVILNDLEQAMKEPTND